MLNVGLTGGIACGKSTVARMFLKKGAHLIDFDKLAHEVQRPGKPAWKEVVHCFGEQILDADKTISRVKLGNIVFGSKKNIDKLNKIVHPFVYRQWQHFTEKIADEQKDAIIIADVPLLFEGKMQHLFDVTILVLIDPEDQIHRLMKRNGLNEEEAKKRLKSQMPIRNKISLADIVIDNQSSIAETEEKVEHVWQELLRREKNIKRRKK
jgi:dephospho-CoA kinase